MKYPIFFLTVILGILISIDYLPAQKFVSSFPQRLGPRTKAYTLEEKVNEEKGTLILFDNYKNYELRYLDHNLQLVDQVDIPKGSQKLMSAEIVGFLNEEHDVHVFFRYSGKQTVYSFTIDKKAGSLSVNNLEIPHEKKTITLTAFDHNNRFYIFKINNRSEDPLLAIYEILGNNHVELHTFPLQPTGLANILVSNKNITIPQTFMEKGSLIFSNDSKVKVYPSPDQFILTVDDREKGETQFLVINTDTWEMTQKAYPIPNYLDSPINKQTYSHNSNSIMYHDLLYQTGLTPTGLTIAVTRISDGQVIVQKMFKDDEELKLELGSIYQGKYKKEGIEHGSYKKIFTYLKKSLAISLAPVSEDQAVLTIGASMDPHMSGKLYKNDVLSGLALLEGTLYILGLGEKVKGPRFLFIESWIHPETLEITKKFIPGTPQDALFNFLFMNKTEGNGKGHTTFKIGDRLYLGHGEKKTYQIRAF